MECIDKDQFKFKVLCFHLWVGKRFDIWFEFNYMCMLDWCRHRWTGRYEAHLWDNSCRREGQARKGRQGKLFLIHYFTIWNNFLNYLLDLYVTYECWHFHNHQVAIIKISFSCVIQSLIMLAITIFWVFSSFW